ncbi:hypothetical protein [Massilia antarctica]|uniref:hypothetical protein n=1 Tax=Massilia antarctica TaxID=2765360 RepID=UPI0011AF3117|nr:hypothetical protein [Massilia sp. H27-R4]MCY0913624.1 hypothetical protein [Massilia sp. H27-R4]
MPFSFQGKRRRGLRGRPPWRTVKLAAHRRAVIARLAERSAQRVDGSAIETSKKRKRSDGSCERHVILLFAELTATPFDPMKNPYATFLGIFALLFAFFASIAATQFHTNDVVAKSPAYVLATAERISQKTRNNDVTYQVNFSYVVDGTTYKKDTQWLKTLAQAESLAASPVEIAYPTTAPAKGIFRSDFDKRDLAESLGSAIWSALKWALCFSILATLFFLWKYPSLRGD